MGEVPTMTTTVDAKKRVVLRMAQPGERFDVQQTGDGAFILRRLELVNKEVPTVKLVRRNGRLMWPVKLDPKEVAAAIRAERDER
jgi:hypothetical protein